MLEKIKCFLLDMDGTVYLGDKLLPGALDFINLLEAQKIDYLFLTNNSSKDTQQYVKKLDILGIHITKDKILSSGEATAVYLKKKNPGAKLYVVGTEALVSVFLAYGFEIDHQNPDVVILGFDTTLTYEKLWRLCDLVREGCPYIATHPDINRPTEAGFMPDLGSFIALVESSTGRKPDIIIGKPYEQMVNAVLEKMPYQVDEIAMIGDRLYTDIAMGESGINTILVLSGETTSSDLKESGVKPDLVVKNVKEIVDLFK